MLGFTRNNYDKIGLLMQDCFVRLQPEKCEKCYQIAKKWNFGIIKFE
jgi:hypothetical protein